MNSKAPNENIVEVDLCCPHIAEWAGAFGWGRDSHLRGQAQPPIVPVHIHELYLDAPWGCAVHLAVSNVDLAPTPGCYLQVQCRKLLSTLSEVS